MKHNFPVHYLGLLIRLYSYKGIFIEVTGIWVVHDVDIPAQCCSKDIPSCSLGWLQSEVSCLLHQSLFKQRHFISFWSVNQTTKLKPARPLTALSRSTYRTYPAPSLVLWPKDRPAWLLSAKAPSASLPVSSGFKTGAALCCTPAIWSLPLLFVSREANVAFGTSEISAGDILMTRPLFAVSSSSVRSPWRAVGWLGTLKGEDQSPCGRHRGLRKGDVKGREMKRRRETAGKH